MKRSFSCVLLLLATFATMATAQMLFPPINRYNSIVETIYQLKKCNQLTSERQEWLMHLIELAMRNYDWSVAQWNEHDAALLVDLERQYPTVPKEKCALLARTVDHERKTIPRAK